MNFLWYSVGMKRKVKKRQRNRKPLLVFGLTLGVFLAVGIAGILLLKLTAKEEVLHVSTAEAKQETETPTPYLEWEAVPEQKNREEQEKPEKETEGETASRYGAVLEDEEYLAQNNIYPKETGSDDQVTLGFVGDLLFDDEYAIMSKVRGSGGNLESGISKAVLERMRSMDIMVVNNEFPYTERGIPTEGKTFTFRADKATVAYLQEMGADLAVLANNHLFDYGEEGLLDTLDTLQEAGIPYVGAGRNIEEASRPVYFIANDIKIAVVAATQIERLDTPDTRGATAEYSGVFRCLNPDRLYETVRTAKENSDFVIVYMHWGTENEAEPDWLPLDQAAGLQKAGADLVIGDHSHCLQGFAYYGDMPVIYSLGNFWFNSKTLDTCMLQVCLDQNGLKSIQFIPAVQSDCRVDFVYGEESARILSYMRSLSEGVSIDDQGFVSKLQ